MRVKGRLGRLRGVMLDFNRFGTAVLLPQPVGKEKLVYLSMRYNELALDAVVGIVHNCVPQDDDYRVGIQFRTQSALQLDGTAVERELVTLESALLKHGPIVPDSHEGSSLFLQGNQPSNPVV